MNNKADKSGRERFVFYQVEVFKEVKWDFYFQQRYREIRCAMYLKR